jgi:hypothetical protein
LIDTLPVRLAERFTNLVHPGRLARLHLPCQVSRAECPALLSVAPCQVSWVESPALLSGVSDYTAYHYLQRCPGKLAGLQSAQRYFQGKLSERSEGGIHPGRIAGRHLPCQVSQAECSALLSEAPCQVSRVESPALLSGRSDYTAQRYLQRCPGKLAGLQSAQRHFQGKVITAFSITCRVIR